MVLLLIGLAVSTSLIYEHCNDESMDFIRLLMLRDDLTKLSNRRGFLSLADHQMKQAKRDGKIFSLIFIDLDGFKRINDTYGHAEGDEALIATAQILEASVRETDMVARLGGDEFVIAANVKDKSEVNFLLGRAYERLRKLRERTQKPYEISFSCGVVFKEPEEVLSLAQMMERSDELMYEEKHQKKAS